jgi:hypothetical protein
MKECYLRKEESFWGGGGRKTIYPNGYKFTYEEEGLYSSIEDFKFFHVYDEKGKQVGYYDKEDFDELFMLIDEVRDKKLDDLI